MVASDSSRRTCARERRWEITLSAVFRKRKCPPRDVTEAAHDLASRERVTTAIDPRDRTPSGAYSMHWRFEMKAIVVKDPAAGTAGRSEEHTSELQSLMRISYAVFCLKKKKQAKT